ncbi:MAG: ABC transporter permease [Opitutaceae bacterium]|nr:ABC transporter permease [Opitutaceae bacterium]
MNPILTLFLKDVAHFRRDRISLLLTFVVPTVLIYIFGNVFGVNRESTGPVGIPLAVVNQSAGARSADAIIAALRQEKTFRLLTTTKDTQGTEVPLTEEGVRTLFRENRIRFALIFPPDTESDGEFGLKVKYLNNPRNEIETQTVNGILQKTIFTAAPSVLMDALRKRATQAIGAAGTETFYRGIARSVGESFNTDPEKIFGEMMRGDLLTSPISSESTSGGTQAGAGFLERMIKIESEQVAGKQVKNAAATRSVGGWAVMFMLFSVSGAATSLFEEKKAGLFQRVLAAPVKRSHILWSKYLFCIALGMVQLTALFAAGWLFFRIDVTSNLPNLILICLAASSACTAFGMLLAAIARSPAAANGIATFLILAMSALGGAWFPISMMPDFIQSLSRLTIVYWAMEGFLQVLWANCTLVDLLPILGVLVGIAAIINAVSVWRYSRGQMFE